MELSSVVVSMYRTNCYLLQDSGEAILIDPGENPSAIKKLVGQTKLKAILITHGHSDHIGAVEELAQYYEVPVMLGKNDQVMAADPKLSGAFDDGQDYKVSHIDLPLGEGDVVTVGSLQFQVLETPGHTPGSICLYEPEAKIMFSGDVLFKNAVGRTDYVLGDPRDMKKTLQRLRKLPADITVYPGHGPQTVTGAENETIAWFINQL